MTDLNPQAIRRFVEGFRQALIGMRRKHYELGAQLLRAREEQIYLQWPRDGYDRGYTTWKEFCDPETGYSDRTCDQFISNYQRVRELELDEEGLMFVRLMRVGWSKLAVILRFAHGDLGKIEAALTHAEQLSEGKLKLQLAAMTRAEAMDNARATNPDVLPQDVGDTNEPLSPSNPAGFVPYSIRFPDQSSLATFTNAVEIIRQRFAPDMGVGKCVAMMSLHYLATHARDSEGGAPLDVDNYISMIEAATGVGLEVKKKKATKKKATKKKASTAARKTAARRRNRSNSKQA